VKYVQVPYEAAKKSLVSMGLVEWQVDGIAEIDRMIDGDRYWFDADDFFKITGQEPTSYIQWVFENSAQFRGGVEDKKKPSIAVIGASGNVGVATVTALSRMFGKTHRILAIARDVKKKEAVGLSFLPGVHVVTGDMSQVQALAHTLQGCDAVYIVTPGDNDRAALATNAINASKAAAVKHLLVVSIPTVATNTIFGKQFGMVEEATKKAGIPFTILRLAIFFENMWGFKKSVSEQGQMFGPVKPDNKHTPVAMADIGLASAVILGNPAPHTGRTYTLCTDQPFSFNEVARAFSRALGKPVTYVSVPYEASSKALAGFGLPQWQIEGIHELYQFIDADKYTFESDFKPITGKNPTTIEQWVTTVAPAFK